MAQTFVIDTSVIAKAFSSGEERLKAELLLREVLAGNFKLYAPSLLWYEFFGVMIKIHKTTDKVKLAMDGFERLLNRRIIEIIEIDDYLGHATNVACSTATGELGYIGPNDACFHGLALYMGCSFLTSDKKHYRKTKDTFGSVLLFDELILNR